MARPVKCPSCGLTFDRDKAEFVHHKNRYYHKLCYDTMMSKVSQEQKDLQELEQYIMQLFKVDHINARIRQQMKRMREEYNYSYSGMLKSLIYFFEVKRNPIEKANGGIGIVPYVYNDAYKYYYELHMAQQRNKDKDIKTFVNVAKEIVIKSPQRQPKIKRLFDMEEEE